ncbi:MAG: succinate dehydrogenase cytochrome b subunit [Bacteroidales bacterium]
MATNWLQISSISKKIYMAIAGLFLIVFLVVHLGINLCLLRNDGGEWFNAAANFMSTNYIVKVFEVFLFLGFILHIILGVIVQIQNWMARPQRYRIEGFSHTSFFSKYMIHTGIIVFIFLVIHMMNFYFVKLGFVPVPEGIEDKHDFYNMAELLFSNLNYSVLYIAFMVFLGFHLNHAFQSAFQTLGLNHNKYTPLIKICGNLYSIVVPLGFCIIPLSYIF